MSGILLADIPDAVLLVQENFIKRGAWLDLQTDLTDHVAVRTLWKNRQEKFDGGNDWTFQAQIDHNHATRAVGLYETDGSAINDTMIEGTMSPRFINTHYEFDIMLKAFQQGNKAIANLVDTLYTAMMVGFYEYLEGVLWGCPAATDKKTPHGLSYWVTKGTTGQEGFYGMDPSGYESLGRAGILSTAQARWRNWFADYDEVTDEDLILKIDTGMMSTQFRSVVDHAQPVFGATKTGIYLNQDTALKLKPLLKAQNMNNGKDLIGELPTIKSTEVTYVPQLDTDTSNPVYVLDWRSIAIGMLSGWQQNLSAPYMVPGKHTVRRVDLDASCECVCTNLRKQMVFATV